MHATELLLNSDEIKLTAIDRENLQSRLSSYILELSGDNRYSQTSEIQTPSAIDRDTLKTITESDDTRQDLLSEISGMSRDTSLCNQIAHDSINTDNPLSQSGKKNNNQRTMM